MNTNMQLAKNFLLEWLESDFLSTPAYQEQWTTATTTTTTNHYHYYYYYVSM